MWNKKFAYVLNYLKSLKAVHKNNPWTHSLHQNKKAVLATAVYFKSLYSCMVAETVKQGVFGIKQEKWTPPLNFAYSN